MKKALSLFLVVLMLVGMLPMTVLNASAAVGDYELVTDISQLSVDAKVIIASYDTEFALSTNQATNNRTATAITKGEGVLVSPSASVQVLTLVKGNKDGTYAFSTGNGYLYAASSSKNYMKTETKLSDNSSWTIEIASTGVATIKAQGSNTRNWMRFNANNGSPIFSTYSSGQTDVVLYVLNEGSGDCNHSGAEVKTVDPTCTEAGSTTITCSCGYTNTTAIAAKGHAWGEWSVETEATCTEVGSQTRTCGTCFTTESSEIAATGHSYAEGTCSACGVVAPAAVATRITAADEFVSGKYVAVVSSYAMGVYESGWVTAVQPVISDDSILDAAGGIWTLTVDGTSVKIADANGVFIAPKGGNNNGIGDGDYSWVWSVNDDGTFTFAGTGDDTVKLASNTGSENKFRAYKVATVDGNPTGYLANFSLYKLNESDSEGGGEPGEPEPGEPTEPEVTEPTEPEATEPSVPTCPNENHNFVGGVCTVCGETQPVGPIDPNPGEPENSATYIFSDYNQEAAIEAATTYKLDDTVSITLSKGWLTSELRVYKGANVVFTSAKPIAQIDFNGGNKDGNADIYVTTDGTTWKLLAEIAYVAAYTDYSVKLPSNVIGVKIEVLDNQIRIKNATLTFGEFVECSHANATEIPAKDATCTESGNKAGSYCADCDTYFGGYEVIPATGHSYAYVDGTVSCSACGDAVALSTIAEAKAFTDKNQVYFVKGIVTYITGNSVYIEDATGAILVYFDKNADISAIALGDELAVWDTLTVYNGAVIETTYTLASESVVVSSGNTVPMKELTIAELLAATESKYLSEKITLKGVTVTASDYNADYGNVTYTLSDSEGNSIVVYRAPAASAEECFQVGDKVDVEAVVAAYVTGSTEGNGYQLTTDHTLITLAKEEPTGPEIDEKLIFYRSNSSGGDLQLGDDIRATFMVQPSGYDEIYLEVTKDGVTTIVEKGTNSTSSIFRYAYVVPAAHMTMDINLTIWGVKDGVTYRGEELVFSVRRCAEAKLSSWITNPAAAGQCKLLMNMLYYGEKAQLQFSVNTDNLATTGLPQEYLDLITTDVPSLKAYPTVDETGKIAKLNTMGFMLQEKVKLNVIFTLTTAITNPEEYTIEVKHIPSREGKEPVVYTYTSEDFTLKGSKAIQFYFDKIAPSQMRDDLEYTVYHNGEAISATYVRSMETVAQYYASNAPALADLINAIMNYADAAKAVFG